MPLIRDFKETIRARVARDPKYRKELLCEGIESMLDGDIATAKTILRDYINATKPSEKPRFRRGEHGFDPPGNGA